MLSRFRSFPFIIVAMLNSLMILGLTQTGARIPQEALAAGSAATIPTVESEHPYQNNEDTFWTITNDSGQNAARIHFSRIELEDGVDKIEIRDASDKLIQEITTSAPGGLWSDVVPGLAIRVVLKSDGSGRFWGFSIDQMEGIDYTTLAYSPHPYPNNSTDVNVVVNSSSSATGTKVHFDRIELEDGVDYIVLKNANDVPYQWITGSHPNGFTSKAVQGISVKIQLVSDGSGRAWGYNVDRLEAANADTPDSPPTRPLTLAESNHPYDNSYTNVWTITNPNTNAVSSKIHFSRIHVRQYDKVEVLDSNDTVVQTFTNIDQSDIWSDYVPGRIVKVRLTADHAANGWGFRVDEIVNSIANPGLAQSDHPYDNSYTNVWTITNPNTNAVSSKIHFSRIHVRQYDKVEVLDSNDTVVQTFTNIDQSDIWSDYVPGRIVKVRLTADHAANGWGFRVDEIVNSIANPGLAQSDHPYDNSYTNVWTITNPNTNAVSSKIHFSRIHVRQYDKVEVLDSNDTVVQTFTNIDQSDIWSDYVPGRIVKVRLTADHAANGWGFRVDDIQPSSDTFPPPAGINGILIQINEPGDVYLNGVKLFYVSVAGEYKIPLAQSVSINGSSSQEYLTSDDVGRDKYTPLLTETVVSGDSSSRDISSTAAAPGKYTITLEYVTHTQTIEVTVGENGGINIVYLPLVQK